MNVKNVVSRLIDVITSALDRMKKVSLKDAVATMSTAKFYDVTLIDARAKDIHKRAASLVQLSQKIDSFDDEDVDTAFRRALLLNAKEIECIAIRMQHYQNRDALNAERVEKLKAQQKKIAERLAKYESTQQK